MKKAFTPDEITAGLLAFDPAEDKTLHVEEEKVSSPVQQKSASQLLKEFLEENNLVLTVSPPSEGIKTVSDGSVIFSAPKIICSYK